MSDDDGKFWLDDEDEWSDLRRRINKRPKPVVQKKVPKSKDVAARAPIKEPKKNIVTPEVSIHLTIPKIKLPAVRASKINRKRSAMVISSIGIIGVVVAGVLVLGRIDSKPSDGKTAGVLSESAQEPSFKTVLPDGSKEQTTSGKILYDPEKKVASYTDKIGSIDITVSQQPLPDKFISNTDDQVEKLAESFNAKEVVRASDPRAYIGTSAQGPQSVIFHKQSLLVFIFSNQTIEKAAWSEYIEKLK